jgi:hypothetical protein
VDRPHTTGLMTIQSQRGRARRVPATLRHQCRPTRRSETELVDRYLGLEIEFKVDAADTVTEAEVTLPGKGLVTMHLRGSR